MTPDDISKAQRLLSDLNECAYRISALVDTSSLTVEATGYQWDIYGWVIYGKEAPYRHDPEPDLVQQIVALLTAREKARAIGLRSELRALGVVIEEPVPA
jgi:hypothetical protein